MLSTPELRGQGEDLLEAGCAHHEAALHVGHAQGQLSGTFHKQCPMCPSFTSCIFDLVTLSFEMYVIHHVLNLADPPSDHRGVPLGDVGRHDSLVGVAPRRHLRTAPPRPHHLLPLQGTYIIVQ